MADFYLVVRKRANGTETEITRTITKDFTTEQIRTLRETALTSARLQAQTNNFRILVYGPTEGDAPHTPDDLIWDSDVNV